MKNWLRDHFPSLIPWILLQFMRLLSASVRMKTQNLDQFESIEGGRIILTWHGRTAIPGPKFRNRNWGVMISNSNDGDIQKYIYEKLGYHVIRGSSGRGGERALIESIRFLRSGNTMAMTPDGPRGPAGRVQLGVLMMAKKSGAKLVPWGVASKNRWLAKSWDRFLIPFPFAKAIVIMGDPILVPPNATESEMEELRLIVEAKMHEVQILAETQCKEPPPGSPRPSDYQTGILHNSSPNRNDRVAAGIENEKNRDLKEPN